MAHYRAIFLNTMSSQPPNPSSLPPIHVLMEVEYSRPQEVPFLEVFNDMRGTPTKYFRDKSTAHAHLNRFRKETGSLPNGPLIIRNLIKYPSGRYGVIDDKDSKNLTMGEMSDALAGGQCVGIAYFHEDTKRGIGVWIQFDVEGHVEKDGKGVVK